MAIQLATRPEPADLYRQAQEALKRERMSKEELDRRARERAISERLHTFKVAGQPFYLVRSRETEPGSMHQVHVLAGCVHSCSCKGWHYRQSCTHAQAVQRRLEREARKGGRS